MPNIDPVQKKAELVALLEQKQAQVLVQEEKMSDAISKVTVLREKIIQIQERIEYLDELIGG